MFCFLFLSFLESVFHDTNFLLSETNLAVEFVFNQSEKRDEI